MSDENRLPIQVILPRKNDYAPVPGGGSKVPLCDFTEELKTNFENQCIELKNAFKDTFVRYPKVPCIGKVTMKQKAIAKSHKPLDIFKSNTCPIVGGEKLNEILIKVTPEGVDRLIATVRNASTDNVRINLTKIEKIEPYLPEEKIMLDILSKDKKFEKPVKIKLFSFEDKADNQYFEAGFIKLLKEMNLENKYSKLFYGNTLNIFKIDDITLSQLELIAAYPGVHKISLFPVYICKYPQFSAAKDIIGNLPMPVNGMEYPIIGLIDSGISETNQYLAPWVHEKVEYVPKIYQNNAHGTFVAGIIEYGSILNRFSDDCPHFKLLDVVVFPNDDPDAGPVDTLSEPFLLDCLHDVIGKYNDRVKVWNMSLGSDILCSDTISDFAVALDEIQDMYGVDIIIAAGNYTTCPLREWPPVIDRGEDDRITIPADSVRAISVGSIASIGIDGFVKKDMPSPFSRRGPGANFIIKPEVVAYGGNCNGDISCSGTGVLSLDIYGNIVEDIGTSFAAPAITATYATIRAEITEDNAREYSKAFLIHSAQVPEEVKIAEFNRYVGFGFPNGSASEVLSCSKNKVTLAFRGKLFSSSYIEFNDFPYPPSLITNGKCRGNIKMTLAYTPSLDAYAGQEYCRTNIDAHFGTYDCIDDDGKVVGFKGQVPLERNWDEKYEYEQVENGFKWNPIKSYSRSLKMGIKDRPWRLRVDACARLNDTYDEQEFVLIITIEAESKADIYTEIIQLLRERGYIFSDIRTQSRVQQFIRN